MANHKSAEKAHRQSLKRALINKSQKSKIRTLTTNVEKLVSQGATDGLNAAFRLAESEIMKSVSRGILKLNTASRKVSRLAKLIGKVAA